MSIKIRRFYLKDIKHQVGASPIWPISAKYELGDYGFYSKRTGRFSKRGNIFDDLEVPRKGVITPPDQNPILLYKVFNSSNTSKNNFTANVDIEPNSGKLELEFTGQKSYFFHLFKARVDHISLNEKVIKKLKEAVENGIWDYRYRIIEMTYTCPDIRFVFSLANTASIQLDGDVNINQSPAKGTINYGMTSSSNMDGSLWIENAASTPFVYFASFKRRELKFDTEKLVFGEDWRLEKDASSSFENDIEFEELTV